MAVIRVEKNKNYTTMSNYHFREKEMSLKAKGLLSVMLSLPDNWDYSIEGLVSICKENKTAIQATLKELETFGYLIRTRKQNDKGQFEYIYNIYEKPQVEKPQTENPYTDIPQTDNVPQLNTKELNTKDKKKRISTKVDIPKENLFSFESHSNKDNLDYYFKTHSEYDRLKPELKQVIFDWMEYKDQRRPKKDNHYTEKGMDKLVKMIVNYATRYGTTLVIEQINNAIANTWQGTNLKMLEVDNGRYKG